MAYSSPAPTAAAARTASSSPPEKTKQPCTVPSSSHGPSPWKLGFRRSTETSLPQQLCSVNPCQCPFLVTETDRKWWFAQNEQVLRWLQVDAYFTPEVRHHVQVLQIHGPSLPRTVGVKVKGVSDNWESYGDKRWKRDGGRIPGKMWSLMWCKYFFLRQLCFAHCSVILHTSRHQLWKGISEQQGLVSKGGRGVLVVIGWKYQKQRGHRLVIMCVRPRRA